MHIIIWTILIISIIFGGVKLYDFVSKNEIVCTEYQVITKIEPYQRIVTTGTSSSNNRSTESQTRYYVYLRNGSIQDVLHLGSNIKIGNEICNKNEWKQK